MKRREKDKLIRFVMLWTRFFAGHGMNHGLVSWVHKFSLLRVCYCWTSNSNFVRAAGKPTSWAVYKGTNGIQYGRQSERSAFV